MTELEITERLILAVEIERAAGHFNVGPGRGPGYVRAMAMPYVHSFADKAGWGRERHKDDEKEYQDSVSNRPTPAMVSEAEEALSWYAIVTNEDHRSALAAWVDCMAGRRFFKDWCGKQGISEKTGRKRKNAAVTTIHARIVRSSMQNCNNGAFEGLLEPGEIGHVDDRIGDAWRGEPYFLTAQSGEDDFSWADARNSRRKKRQKQAA